MIKSSDSFFVTINSVEKVWYKPIFNYISKLYLGTHLPSHDVAHHVRVWKICKDLLRLLSEKGFSFNESFVTKTLIACLFHDTGLVNDRSEKHGLESRKLCEKFFHENPTFQFKRMGDALDAIEHHDDKTFKKITPISIENGVSLTRLVSSADDLDAYGYIGIFRYLEIYLLREVPFEQLPQKVIHNLKGRFANFENYFSAFPELIDLQRERFRSTYNFFAKLDEKDTNSSEIAIALNNCLIDMKMDIDQTISFIKNYSQEISLKRFVENLENEFSEYL